MKLDITSILGLSDEAVLGTPSKQPSGNNSGGSGASSPEVCKCYCRQISYPEGDGANMEDSMTKCSLKSDSSGLKSQDTQTCDVDCSSQSSEASVDCDDSDACSASCDNMTKKPGRHRLDSCDLYYQKCVRNEKIAGKLNWTHCGLLKADSRIVPSQWEWALLCNDVSQWLGTVLESVLLSDAI